jgi:hypothetical protein
MKNISNETANFSQPKDCYFYKESFQANKETDRYPTGAEIKFGEQHI